MYIRVYFELNHFIYVLTWCCYELYFVMTDDRGGVYLAVAACAEGVSVRFCRMVETGPFYFEVVSSLKIYEVNKCFSKPFRVYTI